MVALVAAAVVALVAEVRDALTELALLVSRLAAARGDEAELALVREAADALAARLSEAD